MLTVKFTDNLDPEFINTILDIDASVYPENYQGTFDEIYDRFKANNDIFVLLYEDDKIIGYLCMFPIKKILYDMIINDNRVFDSDIPGAYLEQYAPFNTYMLYLISTVIRPEYQKQGLSKYLINGFYDYILNKKKENILFSTALSTSVTLSGKRMLEKLGFHIIKPLSESCNLHELIMDNKFYELIDGMSK
ncbi:MAG: GNAT family N-acetyltransferase [Treponema sp.]|jgi:GNAT superfamily N-acetyltransferase|nr:GNAT family N-acetyltransferase [Treponema sp.]